MTKYDEARYQLQWHLDNGRGPFDLVFAALAGAEAAEAKLATMDDLLSRANEERDRQRGRADTAEAKLAALEFTPAMAALSERDYVEAKLAHAIEMNGRHANASLKWMKECKAAEAKLAEAERELRIERDLRGQAQRAEAAAEAREKTRLQDAFESVACAAEAEADRGQPGHGIHRETAHRVRELAATLAAGKEMPPLHCHSDGTEVGRRTCDCGEHRRAAAGKETP